MKRILLFCLFILANVSIYSQTEHLTFKGIPIDGHIKTFVVKMQQKGFKNVNADLANNLRVMKGNFAGKNCTVLVVATLKELKVSKIVVHTEEYEGWHSLKSDFHDLVDLYSKKYGQPKDVIEYFRDPYYEGDGYELQALRLEKCVYFTIWDTAKGAIGIEITKDADIKISYEDQVNFSTFVNEQENKNLDDI